MYIGTMTPSQQEIYFKHNQKKRIELACATHMPRVLFLYAADSVRLAD